MNAPAGFDPDFDDSEWNEGWRAVPIAPIPPGAHPSGYRIERRLLREVEIFGRRYRLSEPFDCRLLFDREGRLWMSSTPQEHIMMYNNGRRSCGHVLVGGLGLGLYPQYAVTGAAGEATRFTVVERDPAVRDMVAPTLSAALSAPLDVRVGDIEATLAGPVADRYDTIFLDTWDTLDANHLPYINRLRALALRHLAPGGRVLLWGYQWMVRLFETACRQALQVPPAQRRSWLATSAGAPPQAISLLTPVVDHFEGQVVEDLDAALAWCRRFIVDLESPASRK